MASRIQGGREVSATLNGQRACLQIRAVDNWQLFEMGKITRAGKNDLLFLGCRNCVGSGTFGKFGSVLFVGEERNYWAVFDCLTSDWKGLFSDIGNLRGFVPPAAKKVNDFLDFFMGV